MSLKPWILGLCLMLLTPLAAVAFETKARSALIVDDATGMVLFAKNAEAAEPPASMSKLMTLYMLFEAIRDGRVTPETTFNVSARAHGMAGSRMFADIGTDVPVKDLIQGIIVQSGNDACVVVAEGLAGSEDEFAKQMTQRAHEIGLSHTVLKNASGWPADGHVMSAEDLVALARRIIHEFPEYYDYFKETEFTWNGITQPNRNPLLKLGIGADGLKTGHTAEAGYGLVGSAVQNGQRIVFAVSGLGGVQERAVETEALVKWAFGSFDTVKFFSKGELVTQAPVWLGETATVPLVAPTDIQMLVPRADRSRMTARVVYDSPIEAPITAGQPLGALVVELPDQAPARFDLVAGADAPRGGLLTRISAAARLTRDQAAALLPGHE
ncbi:D-alanyl-D-alanine carboxypeptidase family protein [uncultured Amaricoccus sp.]|uniref:D-alanyl-D-alanine carboxypeptidase family protein n=1 Tax=uncultured Amaricoccus sp. TaxID=339341 RepID=UPI00262464C3|nr:D-alanyl-D-alanine carboxypeptidase family protein [uncultured Amaricoccus sp.]